MTEEIGSDKHKRPSSADIDIALLKQSHREVRRDYETIISQLDALLGKVSLVERGMALGEQRFERAEERVQALKEDTSRSLTAVAERINAIEADKRGPVAIIFSTIAAIGSGVATYFGVIK